MRLAELATALVSLWALVYITGMYVLFLFPDYVERLHLAIRLPWSRPAAERVASVMGGEHKVQHELLRLERRHQYIEAGTFWSTIVTTATSFLPLMAMILISANVTLLGVDTTATQQFFADARRFGIVALVLPLASAVMAGALGGLARTVEPREVQLWDAFARLVDNERSVRRSWRQKGQVRTRLLSSIEVDLRRDLSLMGMREQKEKRVNPRPLIDSWCPSRKEYPYAISTVDLAQLVTFIDAWSTGTGSLF